MPGVCLTGVAGTKTLDSPQLIETAKAIVEALYLLCPASGLKDG